MTVFLVFAASGAALTWLVFLLLPNRPGLVASVGRIDASRAMAGPVGRLVVVSSGSSGWLELGQERLGGRIAAILASQGIAMRSIRADLELTGRTFEMFVGRKAFAALVGLLLPAALVVSLAAGGIAVPVTVPLAAALTCAVAFSFVPDLEVRSLATDRRNELRRALGVYLDLVGMSISGGRGIPEALPSVADIGKGWAFELIAHTINTARVRGQTPWEALTELGVRIDLQELRDLGTALTLVAEDGARVRDSLTARSQTLRARELADAEGRGEEAEGQLHLAQMVLAFGFMLLLAFPAISLVLKS